MQKLNGLACEFFLAIGSLERYNHLPPAAVAQIYENEVISAQRRANPELAYFDIVTTVDLPWIRSL